MPNILDIYGDKSLKGAVGALRENPEYYDDVAKAEIDYEDQQNMPDSSFAWPEERAYPIDDRQMAILSALYRQMYPPEMMEQPLEVPPQVDENLKKAAYLYDFKIPKRKEKPQAVKIASLTDDDYLIPSAKKFPVRDIKEGKLIQNILVKNAHIIGYDHLAEACKNLVEKMAVYKAEVEDINPIIYKYAGLTLSNKEFLDAAIRRRLDFAKKEFHPTYEKMASIAEDMDYNRNNLLKIAATLEILDKKAQVRHLYDKYITNPMESVFNTMKRVQVKVANELFTSDMATMVTDDQVKNILGDDVYEESLTNGEMDQGKLAAVVNSLPRDMITDFIDRIG